MSGGKGILDRLTAGPVIGDGSMLFTLEKRGYVTIGPWSPEAVIKYPEAVLQLHKEFVRAGADVVQTTTFYSTDDRLTYNGKQSSFTVSMSASLCRLSSSARIRIAEVASWPTRCISSNKPWSLIPEWRVCKEINTAACKLARRAAEENDCLVCGSVSPTPSFELGKNEQVVSAEYVKQLEVFREQTVDFLICELFSDVREVELCAREMKKLNLPVALSMRLGVMGDAQGVSVEECAIRMAETGADIIGVNCMYDVNTNLKIMSRIKKALKDSSRKPYLLCQPLGFLCPEAEESPLGYLSLPEYPLALDPRALTRIEAHDYGRKAYEQGINYIGGCCGFEPYHIRSIAQELQEERGITPPVNDMAQPYGGSFFKQSIIASLESGNRCSRDYWNDINFGSGRPYNPPLVKLQSRKIEYKEDS